MAKRKCSAYELILMIERRLNKPTLVKIQRDDELGWRPVVLTTSDDIVRMQLHADLIADQLRKRYDLA